VGVTKSVRSRRAEGRRQCGDVMVCDKPGHIVGQR
jgi:hypothetical protein